MKAESSGIVIGITIGVGIAVLLSFVALICFRCHRRRSRIGISGSRRGTSTPFRENGVDSGTIASNSSVGADSPKSTLQQPIWLRHNKANTLLASVLLHYSFRDLQKATFNFTTLIRKGAYGHVYRAQMLTGETVAVKVLAVDSKQGENEFLNELRHLPRSGSAGKRPQNNTETEDSHAEGKTDSQEKVHLNTGKAGNGDSLAPATPIKKMKFTNI